jgi:hypothetical protein
MANTLNGMVVENVAREGFKAFLKGLTPLGIFSTDLSAGVAEQGTVVNTRIVPASSAAVDLLTNDTASGDREHSNVIEDLTTVGVPVTLNQNPIKGFALTDYEMGNIASGVMADTKDKLIQTKAYAVAQYVLKYCFNLIVPGTYTNTAAYTGAASAFDIDDVIDAGEACAQLGWNMDDGRNYMVLDTAYHAALKKDNAIQDLSASGIKVVQDGQLPKLDVFNVLAAPVLRDATTAYNASNYVRGFVCRPSAMAVAMRTIPCQSTNGSTEVRVMTDDATGASLVMRTWYSDRYAKRFFTFETLFGAASAQVTALSVIKSQ